MLLLYHGAHFQTFTLIYILNEYGSPLLAGLIFSGITGGTGRCTTGVGQIRPSPSNSAINVRLSYISIR